MHPRTAVLAREIILLRSLGNDTPPADETTSPWVVVKTVHARHDGHDPHRIPHNIVLEAKVLHEAAHVNIVELLEYKYDPATSLHSLTLPLLAFTLADLSPTIPVQDAPVIARSVAWQAVSALAFLHDQGVAHRDINPRNIMFDWDGTLKLVDFSTAYAPGSYDTSETADEMVCQVGTGAYRAPELLFGAYTYNAPAIDLWGLGASLADLFRASTPLFDASFGDIGLAASIFRIREMPDADKVTFEPFEPQPLADYLPRLTVNEPNRSQALDFLEGLLRLDPIQRITATEALQHPCLQGTVLLPATHQTQAGTGNVMQLEDGRTLLDVLLPAIEAAEQRLEDLLERDLE